MIARERVLPMTETGATATATSTATAAGAVSWSFASPTATTAGTQHPAPRTSSAATMDVVPGSGMDVVQRYEYTGRELASESSGYYFFRYRVYGPALGQFFTRDPLGYVDGLGLYGGAFAGTLSADPRGMKPQPESVILFPGFSEPLPSDAADCQNNILELTAKDKDIQGILGEIKKKNCSPPIYGCVCCKQKAAAEEWRRPDTGAPCWTQTPKSNPVPPEARLTNPLRLGFCAEGMMAHAELWKTCLWHELVHYKQYCGLTQDEIDSETCEDNVCREMQAYVLTGTCAGKTGVAFEDCLVGAVNWSVAHGGPPCSDREGVRTARIVREFIGKKRCLNGADLSAHPGRRP